MELRVKEINNRIFRQERTFFLLEVCCDGIVIRNADAVNLEELLVAEVGELF